MVFYYCELIKFSTKDNTLSEHLSKILPVKERISIWGDELYFTIPTIPVDPILLTSDVDAGDVAYWPEGSCFCVFYGPTPLSLSDKPVPASKVMLIGRIENNIGFLKTMKNGTLVELLAA